MFGGYQPIPPVAGGFGGGPIPGARPVCFFRGSTEVVPGGSAEFAGAGGGILASRFLSVFSSVFYVSS